MPKKRARVPSRKATPRGHKGAKETASAPEPAIKHKAERSPLKSYRAARDRELDRYIERWARRLLFVDKRGVVRRLTEDEVEVMVGKKKATTKAGAKGQKK